jgi:hypothetical protein
MQPSFGFEQFNLSSRRNLMSERSSSGFLGTYFDRDSVLKLSTVAIIFSWIVLAVYASQFALSILVFVLQAVRGQIYGLGPTDYMQQVLWLVEPPFRGVVYFVALQGLSKIMLMFMDIEDNTRRAARSSSKEV